MLGVSEKLVLSGAFARCLTGPHADCGVAKMAIGLVLGGGAPNLTLMTGALFALDEAGVKFKVITTTGAGMVVGLLYAAPRENEISNTWEKARQAALLATRDWGIDDLIYDMVPINYKIFQKPGMLAQAFSHATNPFLWALPRDNRRQRLLGDTLALMASAMSPSNLKAKSTGLCQPPPWIELLVDFDKLEKNLKDGDVKFRLSTYCIDDEAERTFHKEDITVEHFKAGLAMPFIYAPYKLRDEDGTWKTYLEGSAFKTLQLNPEDVMSENDIDTIIFFDIMGNKNLIGEPRWLIDAWGKSIVAPLTRLAALGLDDFKLRREEHRQEREIRELDALMDLAEPDIEQFKLRRDLHRKKRELRELKDLERLVRNTDWEKELFRRKLEAYMVSYKMRPTVKDPEAQALKTQKQLEREIRKLKTQVDSSNGGKPPEADSAQQEADDRQFGKTELLHDRTELLRMPFRDYITDDEWLEVLDWSHSNMSRLFEIGKKTGEDFVKKYRDRLELSKEYKADPA